MPAVSQPKTLGELLAARSAESRSRDQDTVAAAQNLPLAPWWAAKQLLPSSALDPRRHGRLGNRCWRARQ